MVAAELSYDAKNGLVRLAAPNAPPMINSLALFPEIFCTTLHSAQKHTCMHQRDNNPAPNNGTESRTWCRLFLHSVCKLGKERKKSAGRKRQCNPIHFVCKHQSLPHTHHVYTFVPYASHSCLCFLPSAETHARFCCPQLLPHNKPSNKPSSRV